jgi:hypothetical protein
VVNIDDLKVAYEKYVARPGCGAELGKDAETGVMCAGDCESNWKAWEVLDSNF